VLGSSRPSNPPRLGLAVSRKAAARAVDRNRLKRLTRECFRNSPDLPVMDMVVMPRPAARSADSSTLRASLQRHWQKLAEHSKKHS
jgi:ribonuclease P protein component